MGDGEYMPQLPSPESIKTRIEVTTDNNTNVTQEISMKTQTIEAISKLLKGVDPSFWGSIIIRIQKGEVVSIMKEQSLKIENIERDFG